MKKPFIISITGPTSSGKTSLSILLAKKLKRLGISAEIVGADSRQVYKELNLLSGKVTKKEMALIPHHMLDVVSVKKTYSVADYKKAAEKIIDQIITRGNLPILVGGTGFYVDAVVKGIILPEIKQDKFLRKKLERFETKKLCETLLKLDPKRYEEIDKNNRVRLIRAIEIAKALGRVPKIKAKPKYEVLKINIDLPDEKLKQKIHMRLFARIGKGMIKEAMKLHESGISWKRMEELGLEAKYSALYLQGKISKEEMLKELESVIWQYAKRQRTWFKKN